MLYRVNPKNGDKISQLGFGCMRLPKRGNQIDYEKSLEIIKSAIDSGVNYFDTAYIYAGSEDTLGKALAQLGARDKVKIATKLPIFLCKTNADFDKLFNKQLEKLKTDRIDYYLLHMLGNTQTLDRLKSIGFHEWVNDKKAQGKIINIGFSYHGDRLEFKKIIDSYDWDFCMMQYNYMDENNQAGKDGLHYANSKGLPVFIMEPLRGGTLANKLPSDAKEVFNRANKERSLAEWSFRWLWNQPEVTTVLSGMNEVNQLNENVKTANSSMVGNLSKEDLGVYAKALEVIKKNIKVPCTGCGYCLPCPQGVDIPTCFSCYNETFSEGYFQAISHYFLHIGAITSKQNYASKCVQCSKCEKHCPQGIKISQRMVEVSKKLEPFWFKPSFSLVRKILNVK